MSDIIDYSYIGATNKQQSNVVNYNIIGEQSIDAYSIISANNSTTTGDASTVYGVNEPKIVSNTSVIGRLPYDFSADVTSSTTSGTTYPGETERGNSRPTAATSQGDVEFVITQNGLYIPITGTYSITFTHQGYGSTYYYIEQLRLPGGIVLYEATTNDSNKNQTETITLKLSVGDEIYWRLGLHYSGTSSGGIGWTATMPFTINAVYN